MNNRKKEIAQAIKLFERFRDQEPEYIDEIDIVPVTVAMKIGECDAIEYTTERGGKIELYRHEFNHRSKPILASSWDGKQLILVNGKYNFTEDGIKDKG